MRATPTCPCSLARPRPCRSFTSWAAAAPSVHIVCGFLGLDERPYNPLLDGAADGDPSVATVSTRTGWLEHAAEHRGEGVGQRARGGETCWPVCRS